MARILIVEDEAILAMKTEMDLQKMGHEVVGIVDTGSEALESVERLKPDVILMDIVLKGDVDGIEATVMLTDREHPCRIIYMTAHTDRATVAAAQQTRHMAFLYKPFDTAQLKEVIDNVLAR